MSKFKKIDKDYLITDSSVNSYGYRLLTSGYLMDEFKKNPIGYHMHKRDDGVLVKWDDLRQEGDKVYGKPCINLSHPRGQQTVDEIENGFLNAASCGHFVVLGVSDKPEDYLTDQPGPSVNKWFNRECSLVDIPGNFNALKELFDKNDHPIKFENLADMKPQIKNMTKLFFTPEQITKMNLKADADQATVETAFNDLVAKAAKVDTLATQLGVAEAAKTTAEGALTTFKTEAAKSKIENLIATALTDKKITVELGTALKADYATNPEGLEKVLKAMPAYQSIVKDLKADEATELGKLTWEQLDKANKLEDLKAKNIDMFKDKYKAHFNKEYTTA
jgi:hypothetical protein